MRKPVEQFEIIGDIPDGAMAALARMLLDLADKELTAELESAVMPSDNKTNRRGACNTPAALTTT